MKTIVLDTNVMLDAWLDRAPHAEAALKVIRLIETGNVRGYLAATTITTLYYFARRARGEAAARTGLRLVAQSFGLIPVDSGLILSAIAREGPDFEDDLIIETAIREGASAILTRDPSGFRASPVPAVSPSEWLAGA